MTYHLSNILTDCLVLAQDSFLNPEQEAELNTLQLWFITGGILLLVLLVLWQVLVINRGGRLEKKTKEAQADAERLLESSRENALAEAEGIRMNAELKAKETMVSAQAAAEALMTERRKEIAKMEERLTSREDSLAEKLGLLQERLAELDKRDAANKEKAAALDEIRATLDKEHAKNVAELTRISGLDVETAKKELLEELRQSMQVERATMIRRQQEEARQELQTEARQVMIAAMQRYAADCVFEHTTTAVPLPNEEMKGRIIGREGRNIRTLEAATGTNLLVDETPNAVVISCFDPIRREVARLVLEKLINDGRIHPSRVEEIVEKTRQELGQEILKTGQDAAERFALPLPQNLITLLGTLKYRFSFAQNVLAHSIEVASMAGDIAAELGLSRIQAQRAGLLHDIGKAVDHEVEGTHASIGAEILRRSGEDPLVVNAVAAHHEEVEKESPIAVIVQICDTISAARPGARSETTEFFLRRLEDLERIGNSFPGVDNCYAIQAGRELRVLVKPDKVTEEGTVLLARELAERIESEMRYPGQIRVSVIRETRVVDYAK